MAIANVKGIRADYNIVGKVERAAKDKVIARDVYPMHCIRIERKEQTVVLVNSRHAGHPGRSNVP